MDLSLKPAVQNVREGCPQGWCGSWGERVVPLALTKRPFLPSGQGFGREVVCEVGQKCVFTGGGSLSSLHLYLDVEKKVSF